MKIVRLFSSELADNTCHYLLIREYGGEVLFQVTPEKNLLIFPTWQGSDERLFFFSLPFSAGARDRHGGFSFPARFGLPFPLATQDRKKIERSFFFPEDAGFP